MGDRDRLERLIGIAGMLTLRQETSDQQLSGAGRATTPAQRVRCVPGMFSSLEVKVLHPT